ncbi:MAG TPA: RsmD family RNA methyltransferase, partial [Polyangiaceae bacterium]|nr:RsmD family RNA methyltransferase [Polyangiaceae bacterium]
SAVLVESAREALAVLRGNIETLGLEGQAQVVAVDVGHAIPRVARTGPFDLVMIDPPWALVDTGAADRALTALAREGGLAEGAWVILEHSSRTPPRDVEGFARHDTRQYGDTALTFYKPAILGPLRQ